MPEPTHEGLLAALDAEPGDDLARSALADWYEEHDDRQAVECLRWAVRSRRRPGVNERQLVFGKFFWELLEPEPILEDPLALLPDPLWTLLEDNDEPHPV